jgi:tetratricopeptide (TPR) repeat protein
MQRWTATVTGTILDREGKPLAYAEIQYKNIGIVTDALSGTPKMIEGTGRIYKIKTDKKGAFIMLGVDYGVYEVVIIGPDGSSVYSGQKQIGDNSDRNVSNVLNIDLSTVEGRQAQAGAETNLAAGRKTKEQLALIRQENANAARINRLIVEVQAALGAQDWPGATKILQELISLDANRWEFYQNLGTIQANQSHYEEAIQSFAKGTEVEEKLLPTAADPIQTRANIGDLLLAEGDCYNRLGKFDEAVAMYDKAAGMSLHPGMAHYRACNALTNNGKAEAAIEKCNQAIKDDPTQWEPYQVLGGALNTANKHKEALEAYKNGVEAAKKTLAVKPDSGHAKSGLGQMLNSEGNLLVQLKKYDEAIGVFNQAAEVAAYPAMPYFNVCATYYNMKRATEALAACEHAIASDPALSDAYYIKGAILFGQGHAENGRYAVPPGTNESLNKYLEYSPFGQHATAVRNMLDKLNEEIETPYKPAKK